MINRYLKTHLILTLDKICTFLPTKSNSILFNCYTRSIVHAPIYLRRKLRLLSHAASPFLNPHPPQNPKQEKIPLSPSNKTTKPRKEEKKTAAKMASATTEPLLSSSPPSHSPSHAITIPPSPSLSSTPFFSSSLTPLPEDSELPSSPYPSSPSLKSLLIFGPSPSPSDDGPPTNPNPNHPIPSPRTPHSPLFPSSADDNFFSSKNNHHLNNLHRCRTAPSMSPLNNSSLPQQDSNTQHADMAPVGPAVVRNAFIYLACYLCFGVIIFMIAPNDFYATGDSTHPIVDALYFCIVTMCTIGYGDITPATPAAKIFSILFVIIGFGFVDIFLSGMVSFVLDLQVPLS